VENCVARIGTASAESERIATINQLADMMAEIVSIPRLRMAWEPETLWGRGDGAGGLRSR